MLYDHEPAFYDHHYYILPLFSNSMEAPKHNERIVATVDKSSSEDQSHWSDPWDTFWTQYRKTNNITRVILMSQTQWNHIIYQKRLL